MAARTHSAATSEKYELATDVGRARVANARVRWNADVRARDLAGADDAGIRFELARATTWRLLSVRLIEMSVDDFDCRPLNEGRTQFRHFAEKFCLCD